MDFFINSLRNFRLNLKKLSPIDEPFSHVASIILAGVKKECILCIKHRI